MSGAKRVFITGGASGLGRALAERYAQDGWRVSFGDVNEERAAETLAALRPHGNEAKFLRCDVTRDDDLDQAAAWLGQHWGGVDVVINNAGVAASGRIEDVQLSDWQWIVDINLLGVVRGCKAFVPMLKKQGSGHIVNISSLAGLVNAPFMAPYNAVKAAVVSLSETLFSELSKDGVAVSVVCPSFFRTNLGESVRVATGTKDEARARIVKAPYGADEIAQIICRAVERREFRIVPDKIAQKAWRMKRLLPFTVFAPLLRRQLRL